MNAHPHRESAGFPRVDEGRGGEDLRRLDPRFLLPPPLDGAFEHLAILGGPPGLAETAAAAGIARQVSTGLPEEGSADALFVLHGAGVDSDEAVRCLAPGGCAWFELESRRQMPRGDHLRTLGLYAVLPGFERPDAYVPLDPPGALRWYVETLLPAWTLGKSLRRAGLRLLGEALLPWRYGLALVAHAGDNRGPATILDHPALPSSMWRLHPLLLAHGLDRVVALPFAPGGSEPTAVLKVPRLRSLNGKTEAEQALLNHLRGRLEPGTRGALPVARGLYRAGGLALAVEGYADGCPLAQRAGSWGRPLDRKIGDLRQAAAWLAAFHRRTEVRRAEWDEREAEEWLGRPLDELRGIEGLEGLESAVRRRSGELAGAGLPIVCQHRDFTPWNLLCGEGGNLRVIDWEGARPGPALCDLLHFATHWSELARRAFDDGARLQTLREVWITGRGGEAGEAARQALAEYCRVLRIDRRFVPLLLVAAWVELALRPGSGPREAAYVATLAQGADELFGAWNDAGWR